MVAFLLFSSAFADQRQLYQAGFMAPSYATRSAIASTQTYAPVAPEMVHASQAIHASPEYSSYYLAPSATSDYAYPAAYADEQETPDASGGSTMAMLAVAGAVVGGVIGHKTKQRGKAVQKRSSAARAGSPEMKAALIYSTQTGSTETCANYIAAAAGLEAVEIGDVDLETLKACDGLIVGAPTWHTGADTERSGTDWDDFLYDDLTALDLSGKKVAVFGCGDASSYGDNYCEAMDELATCFEKQGATIIGHWSTSGYDFEESKSVRGGDKFVGCAFDEVNQEDLSEERANKWVEQIKGEGMVF